MQHSQKFIYLTSVSAFDLSIGAQDPIHYLFSDLNTIVLKEHFQAVRG